MLLADTRKQTTLLSTILSFPGVGLTKSLKMDRNRNIVVHKKAKVNLAKDAEVMNYGFLNLGYANERKNQVPSSLSVREKATLYVRGEFQILPGFQIIVKPGASLHLGSGQINPHVNIICTKEIMIGENVKIGPYVTIRDCDENNRNLAGEIQQKPVVIGNDVTIGMKAVILKGVQIGDGAVVEAGSVVTQDVPAGCTVAGIPARVVEEEWAVAW